MLTYFIKSIFSKIKFRRELFYSFGNLFFKIFFFLMQISLMTGLREDSWILISASVFSLSQNVALVGVDQ